MTQIVTDEQGGTFEFPDDATPQEIAKALGVFPPPASAREDVMRTVPAGLARGFAGLVGLPGDARNLIDKGVGWAEEKLLGPAPSRQTLSGLITGQAPPPRETLLSKLGLPEIPAPPTGADVVGAIEGQTGPLYQPQTTAGQYANKAAEFAGGAVAGPLRQIPYALGLAATGGVAAQGAGDLAESMGGPTARAIAEPVAGVATMLAGGATSGGMRTTPGDMAARRTQDMTERQWQEAIARQQAAQAQGTPLLATEAMDSRPMQALTADVAASRYGGPINEFMDARPAQVANRVRQDLGTVAPPVLEPWTLAGEAQRRAEGIVGEANARRTAAASPYYDAASQQLTSPGRIAVLQRQIDRRIEEVGANTPGGRELMRLRQGLQEMAFDPATGQAAPTGALEQRVGPLSSQYRSTRDRITADSIDPNAMEREARGVVGPYNDRLRRILERNPNFSAGQQEYIAQSPAVQELVDGPVGRIARSGDVKTMVGILSDPTSTRPATIRRLAISFGSSPEGQEAYRGMMRLYLENEFQRAAKAVQPGPNRMSGINFRNALMGGEDGTRAANLRTMFEEVGRMQGLPPSELWNGFNRTMDTFERMGRIPGVGSPTAGRGAAYEEAATGGVVNAIAGAADVTKGSILGMLRRKAQQWTQGENLDELARVIVNPRGVELLREMAGQMPGTRRSQMILAAMLEAAREPLTTAE